MTPDGLDMCYFQPHSAAQVLAVECTIVGFLQTNMMGERGQRVGIDKALIIMIDHGIKAG